MLILQSTHTKRWRNKEGNQMLDRETERANRKAADKLAKRAAQLPESVQYAIIQVMPNILNGAFWGFTDADKIKPHVEAIRKDNNLSARKLAGNSCLVEVEKEYLCKAIIAVNANLLTEADVQKMRDMMGSAVADFEKFLCTKAKSEGGFNGTIGIYCVNDCSIMNYKGVNYNAFRLPMQQVLPMLSQYGYQVKVGSTFLTPQEAVRSGQALWDSTVLAPTRNGIFMNIKYCGTREEGRAMYDFYKEKYGLNKK